MSYQPSGMNSLFYTKGGRIKSGIPYTTWTGGAPGTTNSTTSKSDPVLNCFLTLKT